MCGHVGIAGKLEFKDEAAMKRLLLIDYLRGPDSTGFAAIRKTGEAKVVKSTVNPIDLFEFSKFKDALSGHNSVVFMGHNRAATKGVISNVNAHPYEVDHIVGAHNGTLDTASHRALEEALDEKFGTDSHAIIAGIARLGIEATMKLMSGAWSLVWVDRNNNTLNFLRNKERPMWLGYTEDYTKLFYASEWPMIDVATQLAPTAQTYKLYHNKEKHRFFATDIDKWYRFDLGLLVEGKVLPKPKVKELKGKEPVAAASTTYDPFNRPNAHTPSGSTGTTNSTTTSRSSTTSKKDKEADTLHLQGTNESPFAGLISLEKFDEIAKYGCSWCQGCVDFSDTGITIFERQEVVLCNECTGGAGQSTRLVTPTFDKVL